MIPSREQFKERARKILDGGRTRLLSRGTEGMIGELGGKVKKWEVRASKGFEATKRCFRTKRGNRVKIQGL